MDGYDVAALALTLLLLAAGAALGEWYDRRRRSR